MIYTRAPFYRSNQDNDISIYAENNKKGFLYNLKRNLYKIYRRNPISGRFFPHTRISDDVRHKYDERKNI